MNHLGNTHIAVLCPYVGLAVLVLILSVCFWKEHLFRACALEFTLTLTLHFSYKCWAFFPTTASPGLVHLCATQGCLSPCFLCALSRKKICYNHVIQNTVSSFFFFNSPRPPPGKGTQCCHSSAASPSCSVNVPYFLAAVVPVPLTMGNPGTRGRGGCHRASFYCCKSLICRPNETWEEPRVSGAPCFLQGFMLSEQSVYFVSGNLTTNQVLPEVYIWTESLFHFWPIYGVWFIIVWKSHVFSLPPPFLLHCFWCSNQGYWVIKSSLSSCPPCIPVLVFFFSSFTHFTAAVISMNISISLVPQHNEP